MERKHIKYTVLSGLIFLVLFFMYFDFLDMSDRQSISAEIAKQEEMATQEREKRCLVYVVGAVAMPGVYELPEGSRIYDAVKAAGDVLPYADLEEVNMADILRDCEKIYIPLNPEKTSPNAWDKVNINIANKDELRTLPGVGEKTAEKIISYRNDHGRFREKEELKEVPTLGEKKYEKLSSKITL